MTTDSITSPKALIKYLSSLLGATQQTGFFAFSPNAGKASVLPEPH